MNRVAMIDGALVRPEHAVVSVYDRGFLFGDSVFEVLRVYGGRPFAFAAHAARLAASAAAVGIALPLATDALAAEVTAALSAAGDAVDAYVRVTVTRGEGPLGLDPTRATRPRRVILVEPLPSLPAALYASGVSLAAVTTTRATEGTAAAAAKYGNYLANVLALVEARGRGADDALLVDAAGNVLEATTANLFAVVDGVLVTPPVATGVLPGITRATVLGLAEAHHLPTREGTLPLPELVRASEAFLTSSVRELVPVARIDGAPLAAPGARTRELHLALRVAAGAGGAPPWVAR